MYNICDMHSERAGRIRQQLTCPNLAMFSRCPGVLPPSREGACNLRRPPVRHRPVQGHSCGHTGRCHAPPPTEAGPQVASPDTENKNKKYK